MSQVEEDLKNLEQRVDELIRLCDRLKQENQELRVGQESLTEQHAKLAERNRIARSRLESIVERLRALEKGDK